MTRPASLNLDLHHELIVDLFAGGGGMSTVVLTDEQRECIERIALGIFTDMSNSGATLQETLAAVYLSGSENALAAYHEPTNPDRAARRGTA